MKQYIEIFKKLYLSDTINDEQREQIVLSVNKLFEANKITQVEKDYILGKEE